MRFFVMQEWLHNFLVVHAQHVQELKQHHVHICDEEKQGYVVSEHCRRKDRKMNAKVNFPEQSG